LDRVCHDKTYKAMKKFGAEHHLGPMGGQYKQWGSLSGKDVPEKWKRENKYQEGSTKRGRV